MIEPKPFTETMKFNRWRTSMGYLYMAVCAFDFICFPILYSIFQYFIGVSTASQWVPLTLQGAGLFHLAMGAILGISAFTKSQEVMTDRKLGYKRDGSYDGEERRSNKYRNNRTREEDEIL